MGGEKRFDPFDYDVEGDEYCADGIEPPYMCDLSTVIESPISDIPNQGENQREDTEISSGRTRRVYLNMTSFMASCASAWTPEFLIDFDQIQHPNFTTTTITFRPSFEGILPVDAIIAILCADNATISLDSPPSSNRCTACTPTCIKLPIIITLKTNTPIGSNLAFPTGN